MVYSISDEIEVKLLYTANISVVGSEGAVQVLVVNFSELGCTCYESKHIYFSLGTFHVQDCDVHTNNFSILVECTFAINSTAPGIVVIQDDQSQYTTNRTLQRPSGDIRGSVNITDLPAGEYSLAVFD